MLIAVRSLLHSTAVGLHFSVSKAFTACTPPSTLLSSSSTLGVSLHSLSVRQNGKALRKAEKRAVKRGPKSGNVRAEGKSVSRRSTFVNRFSQSLSRR